MKVSRTAFIGPSPDWIISETSANFNWSAAMPRKSGCKIVLAAACLKCVHQAELLTDKELRFVIHSRDSLARRGNPRTRKPRKRRPPRG